MTRHLTALLLRFCQMWLLFALPQKSRPDEYLPCRYHNVRTERHNVRTGRRNVIAGRRNVIAGRQNVIAGRRNVVAGRAYERSLASWAVCANVRSPNFLVALLMLERAFVLRYNALAHLYRIVATSLGSNPMEPTWHPDHFRYERWGCTLALHFPTVKLLALDSAVLERTRNPFATLTLRHRDAQETRGKPNERVRRKVLRYRALLRQGYPASEVRALLRLMEHLLRLDPELARQARDAMRHVEEEELGMTTFVTSFEEIGRADERRDLVLRLLARKVGPLAPELQARVAALDLEAMLVLSEALLDFAALADLSAWLKQQARSSDV